MCVELLFKYQKPPTEMMMYKRKYRQTTRPPQSWGGDVIRSYLHDKQSQQVNKVCRSSARVSPNTAAAVGQ